MSDRHEWSDDELNPWEYSDEDDIDADDHDMDDSDMEADDEVDVVACPACGRDVYEEAEACPYCGHFITPDTRVWSGKSWWWIALALAGCAALIFALVMGAR